MLDQLRRDVQRYLEDLLDEVDRLRRALAALGPGDGSKPSTRDSSLASSSRRRATSAEKSGRPTTSSRSATPAERASSEFADGNGAGGRTASGATKSAVLAALASGNAMTASEVASAAGLGRASVSTTLSKLAKTGEVTKAARGYQITR